MRELPSPCPAEVSVLLTGEHSLAGSSACGTWEAVESLPDLLALTSGDLRVHRLILPAPSDSARGLAMPLATVTDPDILLYLAPAHAAVSLTLVSCDSSRQAPEGSGVGPAPSWPAAALCGRLRAAGHQVTVAAQTSLARTVHSTSLPLPWHATGREPFLTGLVLIPSEPGTSADVQNALTLLLVELTDQVRRHLARGEGLGRMSVPRPARPLRVGLTGGIGSGKSSVARLLHKHGAHVVDADKLARDVLEPGSPGLAEVVRSFGPAVLAADGSLDRRTLASLAFADDESRARLEDVTLPLIAQRAAEQMDRVRPGGVAVYDVPLLAESGMADLFDCVVVVETSLEQRLERLEVRGMARAEALARMSHQVNDEDRRRIADVVIDNNGDREDLADQVSQVWRALAAG